MNCLEIYVKSKPSGLKKTSLRLFILFKVGIKKDLSGQRITKEMLYPNYVQ